MNPNSCLIVGLFALTFTLAILLSVGAREFSEIGDLLADAARFADDDEPQEDEPPAEVEVVEHVPRGDAGDDGGDGQQDGDEGLDWLGAEGGAECGSYKEWKESRRRRLLMGGARNASNRIANGYSVGPGWAPSFVYLVFSAGRRQAICGGVIITSRHILTAAHCVTGDWRRASIRAHAGLTRLGDQHDTYQVEKVCVPQSELRDRSEQPALDLALLRTDRPISYSDRVQPVCLPSRPIQPDETAFAVGLGLTSNRPREVRPSRLQAIGLKKTACPRGSGGYVINKFSLCYGTASGQPCQGDSGGPLYGFFEGRQYLLGLVSWGREDCVSNERSSTVFTDMAKAYPYLKDSSKTCR